MNERLAKLRAVLSLTTRAFGERINLSGGAITNMEKGTRNITDRTVSDLCREFNVNELWLRTGEGEMFVQSDDTLLGELAREYNLSPLKVGILKAFLDFPPEKQDVIVEFLHKAVGNPHILDFDPADSDESDDIEAELESYRRELEAEQRGRMSSPSAEQSGA